MKRFLLAAAVTLLVACQPAEPPAVEPAVVEAVAVVDTRRHVLSIVLIRDDGSTIRYDKTTGRDMTEAVRIGDGLPEEARYVILVPCPNDVAPPGTQATSTFGIWRVK